MVLSKEEQAMISKVIKEKGLKYELFQEEDDREYTGHFYLMNTENGEICNIDEVKELSLYLIDNFDSKPDVAKIVVEYIKDHPYDISDKNLSLADYVTKLIMDRLIRLNHAYELYCTKQDVLAELKTGDNNTYYGSKKFTKNELCNIAERVIDNLGDCDGYSEYYWAVIRNTLREEEDGDED